MKNCYLLFLILVSFSGFSQIVNIPDVNFKAKLLEANSTNQIASSTYSNFTPIKIDTNENGEIEISEALLVKILIIGNSNISSLDGIEAFTNLRKLNCNNNSLITLDINSLSFLRQLDCSYNLLSSLSCQNSNNTIDYFDCSFNNLTSLVLPNFFEFLDQGDQSIVANCSHNQLNSIVINDNEQLSYLNLSYNNFTTLSFTQLEIYGSLGLSNNPLTTVNLDNVYVGSQSPDSPFGYFYFDNTNVTELYVPFKISNYSSISNNPNLVNLNIKNNIINYESYYELDQDGEETGILISSGIQLDNNPSLGLICCDSGEAGYYFGIVPSSVQVTEYCSFTPGGNYNTINGTITYNCSNETPVNSNVKIKINNVYEARFVDDNGSFIAFTSYGIQNVIPEFVEPNYFSVSPPNYTFNFVTSIGNNETANFCVTPNGVHPDLEVTILPLTSARPGFDAVYKLVIKNKGTEIQSGTIALNFNDSILDYVGATPAISSQGSGLLSWNFTNLAPFEDSEITFTVNLNSPLETPSVDMGAILNYTVALTTTETDETPLDNQAEYNQIVVGSFDPNDKTVLEGSQVSISQIDDYLHYLVRFQNTGTAAAENVVVKDFLNDKYDFSTLKMVSASHPYRSSLTNGSKLEVIFESINLPSSSVDEPGSHGYIAFKVKPRSATVIGDVIVNKAYIYFDYNYPIVTNTVSTTYTALGVSSNLSSLFTLYPNPVKNTLTVDFKNNDELQSIAIYNTIGQLVQSRTANISQHQISIDVSNFNQGTYFITVVSNNGKTTKKFVKL